MGQGPSAEISVVENEPKSIMIASTNTNSITIYNLEDMTEIENRKFIPIDSMTFLDLLIFAISNGKIVAFNISDIDDVSKVI